MLRHTVRLSEQEQKDFQYLKDKQEAQMFRRDCKNYPGQMTESEQLRFQNYKERIKQIKAGMHKQIQSEMKTKLEEICTTLTALQSVNKEDIVYTNLLDKLDKQVKSLIKFFEGKDRAIAINAYGSLPVSHQIMLGKLKQYSKIEFCPLFTAQVKNVLTDKDNAEQIEKIEAMFKEFPKKSASENLTTVRAHLEFTPKNTDQLLQRLLTSPSVCAGLDRSGAGIEDSKSSESEDSVSLRDVAKFGLAAAGAAVTWYYSPQFFGKDMLKRGASAATAFVTIPWIVNKLTP